MRAAFEQGLDERGELVRRRGGEAGVVPGENWGERLRRNIGKRPLQFQG